VKRPLSRLRLTPRGRLRRNVVLLLLLPLALLLVLRPCFTHQAALERLQSRFHFGPVDAAQWYPEEAIYALRYDRWYAVCSLFPRAHLAARCQGTDRRPGGGRPPLRLRHPL